MPRIKSAKKRMRQSKANAAQNRTQRSQLRTALKKVRTAAAGAEAQAAYQDAVKLVDRAGRKRLIHPNEAARHKSRLARLAKAPAKYRHRPAGAALPTKGPAGAGPFCMPSCSRSRR